MNSGSPLAARLNLDVFSFFIIVLFIAAAVFVLWIFSRQISAYRNSHTYSENTKTKPTTAKNINQTAKKLKLSPEEKNILSAILKPHPVPNVQYVVKTPEIFEQYFKAFNHQMVISSSEDKLTGLFSLRSKLYKYSQFNSQIKTSRTVQLFTVFTYTPSQGIHHQLTLVESDQNELHLMIPPSLKKEDYPQSLSKISFVFIHTDSSAYSIETRVIRYQPGKENSTVLVCSQTDKIFPLQKRAFPRIDLNVECKFSSVKAENIKGTTEYKINEKVHSGILADSSAGGCRIITELPIKAEQFLFVEAKMDGKTESSAIGKILRTTKNKNDEYILHIKFEKIEESVVNRINGVACHYVEQ